MCSPYSPQLSNIVLNATDRNNNGMQSRALFLSLNKSKATKYKPSSSLPLIQCILRKINPSKCFGIGFPLGLLCESITRQEHRTHTLPKSAPDSLSYHPLLSTLLCHFFHPYLNLSIKITSFTGGSKSSAFILNWFLSLRSAFEINSIKETASVSRAEYS